MGGQGGVDGVKNAIFFPRATPVPSASITYIWLVTVLVWMSPMNDQMAEPFRLKIVQLK